MADNAILKSDATTPIFTAALDEVSYSGQTDAKVALVRTVKITGPEGTKVIGSLNHEVVSAASTNVANISANPSELHSVHMFNRAAYPVYLKLHNTAGTPTAGLGVVLTIGCQAGRERDIPYPGGLGIFTSGIGRSIVTGIATSDATPVAANDCVISVEYTRVS